MPPCGESEDDPDSKVKRQPNQELLPHQSSMSRSKNDPSAHRADGVVSSWGMNTVEAKASGVHTECMKDPDEEARERIRRLIATEVEAAEAAEESGAP